MDAVVAFGYFGTPAEQSVRLIPDVGDAGT